MLDTNLALLKVARRAEQAETAHLMKTFVDTGALLPVLSNIDSQVIFGRRGTGKTHVLSVLGEKMRENGEIAIQVDMRNLGSAGGIYGDSTIPRSQRATRLLSDTLTAIHERLLWKAIESDELDLGKAGQALDDLLDSIKTVHVVGEVTRETATGERATSKDDASFGLALKANGPQLNAAGELGNTSEASTTSRITVHGHEKLRVNFGAVGDIFRRLVQVLPKRRLWILLDEWSEIPLDLQPLLADLLRRTILPVPGISVKIAAIEQRSNFRFESREVGHVGIQIGADVAASLNLDEYMVFDNDERAAIGFFRELVFKHVSAVLEADGKPHPTESRQFIASAFTQQNAFEELVRAAEGVPRDAINILGLAAQKAATSPISMPNIRQAAHKWYQSFKEGAVSADPLAKSLLTWIIDNVIEGRRSKAFLLESNTKNKLVDFLYDERVLHVLRQGISGKDYPGKRFTVYGIDYGCYVDLINTDKAPRGLLDVGDEKAEYVDVPKTDFRSIRRAILDLGEFYKSTQAVSPN